MLRTVVDEKDNKQFNAFLRHKHSKISRVRAGTESGCRLRSSSHNLPVGGSCCEQCQCIETIRARLNIITCERAL